MRNFYNILELVKKNLIQLDDANTIVAHIADMHPTERPQRPNFVTETDERIVESLYLKGGHSRVLAVKYLVALRKNSNENIENGNALHWAKNYCEMLIGK